MANRENGPEIACTIRCLDPATVAAAARRLDAAGVAWVAYTCTLSGAKESVLLVGDALAAEMRASLPAVESVTGMKILAGLYAAELCECDVATLTGAAEHEVVSQLRGFTARGLVAHRTIQGMHYYRLQSDVVRQVIKDALGALC